MPEVDRDALRARAKSFVNGATFMRYYHRLHAPAWLWYVAGLVRCATIVGFPGGVRALLHSGNQAFASGKLLEGYRRLVDTGRVVHGFLVINSGRLHGNPNACAPALVVASLAGTDEGDAVARDVCDRIVDRIHLEKPAGPADGAVAALIADDEYRAFRKRPLPPEFTDGREAHLLDVKIDNQLLRGHSLLGASSLYFLVDPAPRGLILQIPQEGTATTPPPLPSTQPAVS
jgi:hypothetical protein